MRRAGLSPLGLVCRADGLLVPAATVIGARRALVVPLLLLLTLLLSRSTVWSGLCSAWLCEREIGAPDGRLQIRLRLRTRSFAAAVRRCSAHTQRGRHVDSTDDDSRCDVWMTTLTDAARHPASRFQTSRRHPAPLPSCTRARECDANLKSTRRKMQQLQPPQLLLLRPTSVAVKPELQP